MGRMASDAEFGFWADWPLLKLDLPKPDIPLTAHLQAFQWHSESPNLMRRIAQISLQSGE